MTGETRSHYRIVWKRGAGLAPWGRVGLWDEERTTGVSRLLSPSVAALLLLAGATLSAQAPSDPVISLNSDAARIAAPGTSHLLSVRAATRAGAPIANLEITFVAPHTGSSGTFPAGEDPSRSYIRVSTGANGVAAATFVANGIPGVYLVEALAEGADAFTSFAFTNRPETEAPALAATTARNAVLRDVLNDAVLDDRLQLHGPVLLPAGTRIYGSVEPDPVVRGAPRVTATESWFLWIDRAPQALFGHGVQWVVWDASDKSGDAQENAEIYLQDWYPRILLPGASEPDALYASGASNPYLRSLPPTEQATVPLLRRADAAPEDACAILIFGPDTTNALASINRFNNYLSNNNLVSGDNLLRNRKVQDLPAGTVDSEDPVSLSDIRRLIQDAKDAGCKKLYWGFFAHGGRKSTGGIVQIAGELPGTTRVLSYEQLVQELKALGPIELCIIQGSCFSGQLISWIQGRGFTGQIITSADSEHVAWSNAETGNYVANNVLDVLENNPEEADANNDGTPTFVEVMDFVRTNRSDSKEQYDGTTIDYLNDSEPSAGSISPTGTRQMRTFGVRIDAPNATKIRKIRRPLGVPLDEPFTVTIQVRDPTIASVDQQEVTIPAGKKSAPVVFTGHKCAATTYTVNGAEVSGQRYISENTIQVGDFLVEPDSVVLGPGERMPVKVTRYGASLRPGDPTAWTSSDLLTTTRNGAVAEADPFVETFESGQTVIDTMSIVGLGEGDTFIDFEDLLSKGTKSVKVKVLAAKPRFSSGCHFDRDYQFAATVAPGGDPGNNAAAVGMPANFFGGARVAGDRMTLGFQNVRMIGGTNPFDCLARIFGLVSQVRNPFGPFLAGLPGVISNGVFLAVLGSQARFANGEDGDPFQHMTFTYTLGEGVFPGGPVTYNMVGTAIDPPPDPFCSFGFELEATELGAAGGSTTLTVNTQEDCPWSVTSGLDYVQLPDGADRVGPGTATITLLPNGNPGPRPAIMTLEGSGQLLSIKQFGTEDPRPKIVSIVNAASFERGFAAGGWVTIRGLRLSETTRTWGDADFDGLNLPTSLDGVSAAINGKPAYVFYVSPTQLNVLAADDELVGLVHVAVTTPQGTTDANLFYYKQEIDPALFQFTSSDELTFVAAVHADATLVGKPGLIPGATTRPASPGDVILWFGTGFGPTEPPTPSGQLVTRPAPLAVPVAARIGGKDVVVQFAGVTGSGLYQFNVVVPEGLEPGDHLVEIFINGIPIQRDIYITVGP